MTTTPSILVGVDGSLASLHALDWATALAKKCGASLTIACSYSLPTFAAASLDGGYAALDDSTIQEGARMVLSSAAERVTAHGVPVSAQIASGDPAGALVELSQGHNLVVVGTRGRSGFAERILGTVSSALPAHSACPVVVVPGRDLKEDEPSQRSHRSTASLSEWTGQTQHTEHSTKQSTLLNSLTQNSLQSLESP